jgi:hypothetical protein
MPGGTTALIKNEAQPDSRLSIVQGTIWEKEAAS